MGGSKRLGLVYSPKGESAFIIIRAQNARTKQIGGQLERLFEQRAEYQKT